MANSNIVLVEGKNDKHVICHLLNHYAIPEGRIAFKDKEGINNMLESLPIELRASELERLGIVIDADINLTSRWQSLRDTLIKSGYVGVPDIPEARGTIIHETDRPIVGIWLMPDNKLPGMLEDFVSFLVPAGDPLWSKASDCISGISEAHQRFPTGHRIKAHIHTWLAWQKEPGTPLGSAITKRYLDAEAPHARLLMNWIQALFVLDQAS